MASGIGMHCLPMTHKIIMQAIVSYPLHTHNEHDENEILKKMRLSTCIMKQFSLLKQMAQYFYWGPSLLGAEFVRGRVCQGPSLSGAEMSRNPLLRVDTTILTGGLGAL